MNKLIFVILASIALISCNSNSPAVQAETAPASDHVAVYYFHGNFRCVNCTNFEKFAKVAVEKYYANEVKEGKLTFQVISVDEKPNGHYLAEYELYTKSLIVSLVKSGKETKWKNLQRIWDFARNEEGYISYFKNEVDQYLEEL